MAVLSHQERVRTARLPHVLCHPAATDVLWAARSPRAAPASGTGQEVTLGSVRQSREDPVPVTVTLDNLSAFLRRLSRRNELISF